MIRSVPAFAAEMGSRVVVYTILMNQTIKVLTFSGA